MVSKVLFGLSENYKRPDILASEALDRIFTPGKTELIANCDTGEDISTSPQEETYVDFDADENGVIRSLRELLDPESNYEERREAAKDIIEEAIEDGDQEADPSKVDMIADMVLAKIEAHGPEDDEVEVTEETSDTTNDEYVPDEDTAAVAMIADEGDYNESPIAISTGSKAEELIAKREALRAQMDKEKADNKLTLEQKKAALDQQRDIIRRQAALKAQYAMMGNDDEDSGNDVAWIPEETTTDVDMDSDTGSVSIIQDNDSAIEPVYEESCKSDEDVQEACKSDEDVQESLTETGIGGNPPAEDPNSWTPETVSEYGEGCGGETHSK